MCLMTWEINEVSPTVYGPEQDSNSDSIKEIDAPTNKENQLQGCLSVFLV